MASTTAYLIPAVHHFEVKQSDTFRFVFAHFTPGTPTNVPLSLAGATVNLQVRKKPYGEVLLNASTDIGIGGLTIGGVDNNEVHPDFDIDCKAGEWVWELEIVFISGERRTTMGGNFVVVKEVAKPVI